MNNKSFQRVTLHLPREVVAACDALASTANAKQPFRCCTRSDILREAIQIGLGSIGTDLEVTTDREVHDE